jgi:hypothetical protein
MKVIGLESGRLTLLVDVLELSPVKGGSMNSFAEFVCSTYGFVMSTPPDQQETSPWRFQNGEFETNKRIKLFEIYPSGIVIQSNDTDGCDEFLENLFDLGGKILDLRRPSGFAQKIYMSNIVVEFEERTVQWVQKLQPLQKFLNDRLKKLYGIDSPAVLHRLAFKPDPNSLRPIIANSLSDFALERRIYVPFDTERYYSVAPIPTREHIQLLELLESISA